MIIKIEGMSCGHCVNRVKNGLEKAGAVNVSVDLKKGEASFENLDESIAKEVIEDLGFDVK